MAMHKPTKDEQDFVRVVKLGTALGLSVLTGFLYSLKQVHPSIEFEFGFGTVVSSLAAAVFSWLFCGVLFRTEFDEGDTAQSTAIKNRRMVRWVIFFLVISAVSGTGVFLYSLKDVAAESRREVIQGTGIAVVVLAIGGFLIHKTVVFFEEQDRINLALEREEKERADREDSEG
jgi:hypothetical protein